MVRLLLVILPPSSACAQRIEDLLRIEEQAPLSDADVRQSPGIGFDSEFFRPEAESRGHRAR
jgi:hypothetical protein